MSKAKTVRMKTLLAITVLSLALVWGCSYKATRGYVGENNEHATAMVGDYTISTMVHPVAIREPDDSNRYRIYLVAEYQQRLEEPTDMSDIPEVAVRDLCVEPEGTDVELCPRMTSVVITPTSEVLGLSNPELYHETFESAPLEIDRDRQRLSLEYTVELLDRETGEQIDEARVTQELHKYKR